MKNITIFLMLILLTSSCNNNNKLPNIPENNIKEISTAEIIVDGKKYIFQEKELLCGYKSNTGEFNFALTPLDESFGFFMDAKIKNSPDIYKLYTCYDESKDCDKKESNGSAKYISLKPKLKYPCLSYLDSEFELKPLTLEIISVSDASSLYALKRKKIKGNFIGVLALIQRIDPEPLKIREKITVSGKFDVVVGDADASKK